MGQQRDRDEAEGWNNSKALIAVYIPTAMEFLARK
jgi:hypothetical protein